MNDRMTSKILREARASLEPTRMDRDRVHRKVMGTVGAATVITAAGAGAAKVAGCATATGLPLGVVSTVKLTVSGILLVGVITIGVVGSSDFISQTSPPHPARSDAASVPHRKSSAPLASQPTTRKDEDALKKSVSARKTKKNITESSVTSPMSSRTSEPPGIPATENTGAESATGHQRKNRPTKSDAVPNDNALLNEIVILRNASEAIRHKNFSTAAQILDQYRVVFPGGVMRQERDGLMIKALCGAGKIQQARKAFRAFENLYGRPPLMFQVDEQCTVKRTVKREVDPRE